MAGFVPPWMTETLAKNPGEETEEIKKTKQKDRERIKGMNRANAEVIVTSKGVHLKGTPEFEEEVERILKKFGIA